MAAGLPEPAAGFVLAWVHGINAGEWDGQTGDLERLLARKPAMPTEFLQASHAARQLYTENLRRFAASGPPPANMTINDVAVRAGKNSCLDVVPVDACVNDGPDVQDKNNQGNQAVERGTHSDAPEE